MQLGQGTLLQGGKYRIEGVLGQGGFGITYRAVHTALGTTFAIKEFYISGVSGRAIDQKTVTISLEVNRDGFASQREKFRKEAQRLQTLSCDHIVKVYDLFDENNTSYYVMEYIEGCSLERWLQQRGKLSEYEVQDFLRQILEALNVMHSHHLWHLDIKPNNIMRSSNGKLKLIDFGASKLMDPNRTMTTSSAIASTPGFASLEQMAGDMTSFGPWTDFYALGATLYILLTGNRPPLPNQIMASGSLAFQFPSGISQQMHNLVVWMMQPNHRKRPQTVSDIYRILSNGLSSSDETVTRERSYTPPRHHVYPTSSSSGNPWGWIIAVVIGIVLLLVIANKCSDGNSETDNEQNTDSIAWEVTQLVDSASAAVDSTVASAVDSKASQDIDDSSYIHQFSGSIGYYTVNGTITIEGPFVRGQYGYKGRTAGITIRGELEYGEDGVYFSANEYNSEGVCCGSYIGKKEGNVIYGDYTNYNNEMFDFTWKLH